MYGRLILFCSLGVLYVFTGCVQQPPAFQYNERVFPVDVQGAGVPGETADILESGQALELRQAVAYALGNNPRMKTAAHDIAIDEARAGQARLFPNPEIELEVEEFSGSRSGFSESETKMVVSQPLVLWGKRSGRIRIADIQRTMAVLEYERTRRALQAAVSTAFYEVLGAQKRVALTEKSVEIAGEIEAVIGKRVSEGAASPVEYMRAKAALAAARMKHARSVSTLEIQRVRLAEALGVSPGECAEVSGEFPSGEVLPPLLLLKKKIVQAPELARCLRDIEKKRAALELERAERFPDVRFSGGFQYFAGDDAKAFIAGLSVPVPLFDRNQAGIREAQERLSRSQFEYKAARSRLIADLTRAYTDLEAARRQESALRQEILPETLKAFQAVRKGYQKGKFPYMDLLTTQKELQNLREQYVQALVDRARAAVRLQQLTGERIEGIQNNGNEQEDR